MRYLEAAKAIFPYKKSESLQFEYITESLKYRNFIIVSHNKKENEIDQ